eukprot:CAMPEP_0183358274 /NCGR_PEP_ID=MMETSP0164_2-20130417/48703_1 /TAXON_ID=221442 /ORGANISM="Coccolithus pelagicus ssp braarudi, Strain PLY182g" /LENGTH=48 /DNA_ID= /DNA_START= /DNA_END= /DNA_ORIENTATION=
MHHPLHDCGSATLLALAALPALASLGHRSSTAAPLHTRATSTPTLTPT